MTDASAFELFEHGPYKWTKAEYRGVQVHLLGCATRLNRGMSPKELTGELLRQLDGTLCKKLASDYIRDLNGNFAGLLRKEGTLLLFTDRVRSFPLFYTTKAGPRRASNRANWLLDGLRTVTINSQSEKEFLYTGFTTGANTLVEHIQQVQAGEIVQLEVSQATAVRSRYYEWLHLKSDSKPSRDALHQCHLDAFERMIRSLRGRTAVIPLSGGYDSRLIAAMLKHFDYGNVVCFTYGRKNSWESMISRKAAQRLGFEWHHIDYSPKKWRQWIRSTDRYEYEKYASNLSSVAHFQDLPAIQALVRQGLIPTDSIFIPGHSGDFIAGGHLPKVWSARPTTEADEIAEAILRFHYALYPRPNQPHVMAFKSLILSTLSHLISDPSQDTGSAFEYFDWQERQAKFIINSVRAYEYEGFEWRMPLWDNTLMDYWSTTHIDERIEKRLYDECVLRFFEQYNVRFEKPNPNRVEQLAKQIVRRINKAVSWNFFTVAERLACLKRYEKTFAQSFRLKAVKNLLEAGVNSHMAHEQLKWLETAYPRKENICP